MLITYNLSVSYLRITATKRVEKSTGRISIKKNIAYADVRVVAWFDFKQ